MSCCSSAWAHRPHCSSGRRGTRRTCCCRCRSRGWGGARAAASARCCHGGVRASAGAARRVRVAAARRGAARVATARRRAARVAAARRRAAHVVTAVDSTSGRGDARACARRTASAPSVAGGAGAPASDADGDRHTKPCASSRSFHASTSVGTLARPLPAACSSIRSLQVLCTFPRSGPGTRVSNCGIKGNVIRPGAPLTHSVSMGSPRRGYSDLSCRRRVVRCSVEARSRKDASWCANGSPPPHPLPIDDGATGAEASGTESASRSSYGGDDAPESLQNARPSRTRRRCARAVRA